MFCNVFADGGRNGRVRQTVSATGVFKEVAASILPDGLLDLLPILLVGEEIGFQVRVGRRWAWVVAVIGGVEGTFAGVVVGASVRRDIRGLCCAVRGCGGC